MAHAFAPGIFTVRALIVCDPNIALEVDVQPVRANDNARTEAPDEIAVCAEFFCRYAGSLAFLQQRACFASRYDGSDSGHGATGSGEQFFEFRVGRSRLVEDLLRAAPFEERPMSFNA